MDLLLSGGKGRERKRKGGRDEEGERRGKRRKDKEGEGSRGPPCVGMSWPPNG